MSSARYGGFFCLLVPIFMIKLQWFDKLLRKQGVEIWEDMVQLRIEKRNRMQKEHKSLQSMPE
jgi:hypothetical protein